MAINYIDEAEIRRTISVMKPKGELFEVRIIPANKKKPSVGYFRDAETLIRELNKQQLKGTNVYITLQAIKEACYSREQRDCFIVGASTTSDHDVEGYNWLMIDLDPERPSGVSSSDEELKEAKDLGNRIYKYLKALGFEKPLLGYSGNGVHLLYKVSIANTKDRTNLIQKCLKALNLLFGNEKVKVDCANFNPSRVCKLYGTLAQKGKSTEERPHRMSRILSTDSEYKPTDVQYLEKLCEVIPKEPEKPQRYNNYKPSEFDLEDWLFKYGLNYRKVSETEYDKYVLDECPFDSSHKAPDASIFKFRNGAIGFKCFHNSCQGYSWHDVRIKYEPEAYEKKRQYEEKQMFNSYNRNEPVHIEPKENKPVFYTAKQIVTRPKQIEQIIKTGIENFDKKYRGLRKSDVTILSGQTGSAKSTLLSQIILNAIDADNHVAVFSGELKDEDYMKWMNLQAAGKENVEPTQWTDYWTVPYEKQLKIADWLEGKFWLYNNDYGFHFEAIIEQFEKMIDEHRLDLLCVDNLMALDISSLSNEKYEAQSRFAWEIHELAKRKNVHIIIVCHPRKPNGLLGLYDVSGTSDIVNAVDNIVYVYRYGKIFENNYNQVFGRNYQGAGSNIWYCAKSRFGSVDEEYNDLFYEVETKRLKNSISENRQYGWYVPEFEPATELPF